MEEERKEEGLQQAADNYYVEQSGADNKRGGMFERFMDERIAKAKRVAETKSDEHSKARRSNIERAVYGSGHLSDTDLKGEAYKSLTGREHPYGYDYTPDGQKRLLDDTFAASEQYNKPIKDNMDVLSRHYGPATIRRLLVDDTNPVLERALGASSPVYRRIYPTIDELREMIEIAKAGGREAYDENEKKKENTSKILNLSETR